jgi:hypothetical protein
LSFGFVLLLVMDKKKPDSFCLAGQSRVPGSMATEIIAENVTLLTFQLNKEPARGGSSQHEKLPTDATGSLLLVHLSV